MIVRGVPDVSLSARPLLQSLADAASWSTPRADPSRPATCLRDRGLEPARLLPDRFATVAAVIAGRFGPAAPRDRVPKPVRGGRLVVYYPDADLADGAAEEETAGYFDAFNTPPWDTWVGYFQEDRGGDDPYGNYLLAWVPPVFVPAVERGIHVNPEQCIRWLDETDCAVRGLLAGDGPSPSGPG